MPFSIQTRRGSSEVDGESEKKSSGPFSMLEGMFRVVKSSPVSEERAVTWRVYEAYDFASPIAYIVESVTVSRSSMTKDLKRDQLTQRQEHRHPHTFAPERPMTRPSPHSFRQSGGPYDHWSGRKDLLPPDRPLSSLASQT